MEVYMNKLTEKIKGSVFKKDVLYLLCIPGKNFGFFCQNGTVYFGRKSQEGTKSESVNTSYLDMNLGIYMQSNEDKNSFSTGYYDLLSFKGDLDSLYFDLFYKICTSYCNDSSNLSFPDFFSALTDLFNTNKKVKHNNTIGTIGELFFLKYVYEQKGINLTDYWHLNGINSKFDLSLNKCNIEIKTSVQATNTFLIKHDQIYNNQNNYLCAISILYAGNGDSLNSLFEYFMTVKPFANNVRFQIELNQEYIKSADNEENSKKFLLDNVRLYSVDDMQKIEGIPQSITELEFLYNFSSTKQSDINEVVKENI